MQHENLYEPNCIRTVGGRYINILTLDPATIHIADIAHALSRVQRFGGHLPREYSVAQHSIGVLHLFNTMAMPEGATPEYIRQLQLQALMHDASDAIIGDMPSPIKQHLPDFQALEARIMQVLAAKFGFPWPIHPLVKAADRMMFEHEWHLNKDPGGMAHMTPAFAAQRFLDYYHTLAAPIPTRKAIRNKV